MSLTLIQGPQVEPLTLAQAKAHLRVDHNDEDDLISSLIVSARQMAEDRTRRAIGLQTWMLGLPGFPVPSTPIDLPKPPHVSVVQVAYDDPEGHAVVMPALDYQVIPGDVLSRLRPVYSKSWPETLRREDAARITYQTGYTTPPAPILSWIKLVVGTLYDSREMVLRGETATVSFLPSGLGDGTLDPYIVPSIA